MSSNPTNTTKIDATKRIGLIAGSGRFPILFTQSAKAQNQELTIIAVGIEGQTLPELKQQVDKMEWISLGQMESLIRYFQKEGVTKAVMAGGVPKSQWLKNQITLDEKLQKIIQATPDHRDQALLKAVADELARHGIQLLDSTLFLDSFLAKEGVLGRHSLTQAQREDVRLGKEVARVLSGLDIGQTVVVKGGAILAVEALEGTDETIRRAARFGGVGAVVVKMARPDQDMRFDIPVVGLDTIISLQEAQACVLAVETARTLILDYRRFISSADEMDLAVVGVKP